ncbi:MAG: hypothetical protein A49_31290 [Methyloceanibacter sp.]|nr:MAG: hypothetical protein A49_31290 [Methyloceanibacter sp.]
MQVRHVPNLLRLHRQRLDEMRMRVPERGDGDAAREVEIALAGLREEKGALTPRERQSAAGICRKKGRHETSVFLKQNCRRPAAASRVRVLGLLQHRVNWSL